MSMDAALGAIARTYRQAILEQLQSSPLFLAEMRSQEEAGGPLHGPFLPELYAGDGDNLHVYLEPRDGALVVACPGWESEPVEFTTEAQVDELIEFLTAWKAWIR